MQGSIANEIGGRASHHHRRSRFGLSVCGSHFPGNPLSVEHSSHSGERHHRLSLAISIRSLVHLVFSGYYR
jgi:hypothetical protein